MKETERERERERETKKKGMTQQFNVNHGHPDGDLMTSILAYEWYLGMQKDIQLKV